jgi:hypothetical protein
MRCLFKNPVIFGISAGIAVILFNLAIAAVVDNSMHGGGYLDFAHNDKLVYLIPFAVAVQMGLFRHYRNIATNKTVFTTEMVGASGSAFSTVTLVACCLACCTPPVWNLFPALGIVLAASSLVMQYQDTILAIALLANLIGSVVLLLLIRRHGREPVKII